MSPSDGIIQATGDLFPTLPGIATSKGVAMNPPPTAILGQVSKMVTDAMASIPPGERAQLVGIATQTDGKVNTNLALVLKAGEHAEVLAWFGKTWGTPVDAQVLGVGGRLHF